MIMLVFVASLNIHVLTMPRYQAESLQSYRAPVLPCSRAPALPESLCRACVELVSSLLVVDYTQVSAVVCFLFCALSAGRLGTQPRHNIATYHQGAAPALRVRTIHPYCPLTVHFALSWGPTWSPVKRTTKVTSCVSRVPCSVPCPAHHAITPDKKGQSALTGSPIPVQRVIHARMLQCNDMPRPMRRTRSSSHAG
jgi:hypothetical protein